MFIDSSHFTHFHNAVICANLLIYSGIGGIDYYYYKMAHLNLFFKYIGYDLGY